MDLNLTPFEIEMLKLQIQKNQFYDLYQTANLLGVSVETIYRYVRQGLLEKIKIGNRTYFRKEVIDTLIP